MPNNPADYEPVPTTTPAELEPNTLIFEDEEHNHGFIVLSKLILYADNLSKDAKILYAYLLGYAYEKDQCFPGYETLCKDMGASENTVRKFMRELEAVSLLRQVRRGLGKTNIYILLSLSKAQLRMQAHHDKSRTSDFEVLEPQFEHAQEPQNLSPNKEEVEERRSKKKYPSKIRNEQLGKKGGDYVNQRRADNPMDSTQARHGHLSLSAEGREKDTSSQVRFYDVAYEDGIDVEAEKQQSKYRASHPQAKEPSPAVRSRGFEPVGAALERSSTRRGRQSAVDEDRQFFVDVWEQFGDELNDQAKTTSSVSQLLNIFRAWQQRTGGDREVFLNLLYEARSRTKERSGSIRLKENKGGDWALKNRAPYFFAILRDLTGLVDKPKETP